MTPILTNSLACIVKGPSSSHRRLLLRTTPTPGTSVAASSASSTPMRATTCRRIHARGMRDTTRPTVRAMKAQTTCLRRIASGENVGRRSANFTAVHE